jgi:hypothetical protein
LRRQLTFRLAESLLLSLFNLYLYSTRYNPAMSALISYGGGGEASHENENILLLNLNFGGI